MGVVHTSAMPGNRRIPASKLALDYGASLNEFVDEAIQSLAKLDGANAPARGSAHRLEVCAAVSAAMTAAFDASTLSADERDKLRPMLNEVLVPYWNTHCAENAEAAQNVARRAEHYLAGRVAGSQVKTAVNIVAALLVALEVPEERRVDFSRALAPAFAHRMVSDAHHLNDLRSRLGIEFSVIASLAALLPLSLPYESILRALRLG